MEEEAKTILKEIDRIIRRNITDIELLRKIWSMAAMLEEIKQRSRR